MSAQPEQGRRLALIVAVSDYQDPTLQQLRAPGQDARDLAEVLADPAIGGFEVHTLIDTPSDQLLRRIARFCGQPGPSDLLLLYLSCHGVLDDRNRLYYATIDTERAVLAATAVSAQWLNDQLDDCRARRQILVLDCCHSGAFAKGAKGANALALHERFGGRGKVVLTASGATEYSFEGADVIGAGVRSVFTHAVVDGLRTGEADRDKDGLITITDLYQHVYDTVRMAEPRQTPKLWTYGAEGDLLVAHSPRGAIVDPIPLPEDLRLTLESPRLIIRESAVIALAELLDHGEPGLALTAKLTLQRIHHEDQPRIAVLARAALDAEPGHALTRLEAEQQARKEAGERARREADERRAAEQRQARREADEQAQREAEEHARTEQAPPQPAQPPEVGRGGFPEAMKWARPEAAEPSPPPPAEAQREDEGWPGQKTEEQAVGKVEERGSRQIGLPGSHAETSRITPSDQAKTNADVAGQPRKKLLVLGGVVGGVIIAIVAVVIAVAQSSSGPSTQPAARPTFGTSSPASTTGAPSAKLTVAIKDLNFDPGTLQAKVGQTVTITNQDSVPHDWTDKGGAFHSPTLDPGQSFSYAFQKAGTYNVYCTIHPFMTQTVVVS